MAGKSTTLDTQLLQLLLNGTAIANIADNAASSPLTLLYVALHTASPGVGGNQATNEATYTSYARVSIPRTSGGFAVSAGTATLAAAVTFPTSTGGSETETYVSVGIAGSGNGQILYFGAVSPTIAVSSGVTPQLTTSTTITET